MSASGVLIDSADKGGPGLRALVGGAALSRLVRAVHEAGLQVALAGKLRAEDLPVVADTGADIAGVRGAACDGGRTGRISTKRVVRLASLARRSTNETLSVTV